MKVSRLEAQLLLERYPECGNLLLRPSGDRSDGVSVSTRQTLSGCARAAPRPAVGARAGAGSKGAWSDVGGANPTASQPGSRSGGRGLRARRMGRGRRRRQKEGRGLPGSEAGHPAAHCACRTPLVRHYKVKREGPKYVIDVEEPVSSGAGSREAPGQGPRPAPAAQTGPLIRPQVSCASLQAVVNYFVLQTKNALVPFLLDEDYEKVLGG